MDDWSLLNMYEAGGSIRVVFEQKQAKEHVDIEIIYSSSGTCVGLVILE